MFIKGGGRGLNLFINFLHNFGGLSYLKWTLKGPLRLSQTKNKIVKKLRVLVVAFGLHWVGVISVGHSELHI